MAVFRIGVPDPEAEVGSVRGKLGSATQLGIPALSPLVEEVPSGSSCRPSVCAAVDRRRADAAQYPNIFALVKELGLANVFTPFTTSGFWTRDGLSVSAPVFSEQLQLPALLGQFVHTSPLFRCALAPVVRTARRLSLTSHRNDGTQALAVLPPLLPQKPAR